MKVRYRSMLMAAVMVFSSFIAAEAWWAPIRPGDHVYDAARHQEWIKAHAQFMTQALNTATEIANQVRDLTTISPEALMANMSGINTQLGEIKNAMTSATGLMHSAQSAEEAWDNVFNANFLSMSSNDKANYHQNVLKNLENTYQDSLRVTKINSKIDTQFTQLNDALSAAQTAEGNKAVDQANAEIKALGVTEEIKSNQLAAQTVSILSAQNANFVKQEQEAKANARKQLSLGAADPYNPTDQDKENFTRKPGRGFFHF